jgi:TetR/AcrR family transcriptional regulator, cholesterol catabolism regulator
VTAAARTPRAARRRRIETVVRDKDLVARRHEEIFRAASRVFISRGYHRATVREIAREAGLSLGGLYAYIKTKEDMLYLVFEKLTADLRANIRQAIDGIDDPAAQMRAALTADLTTIERYQDAVLLMYQETKSLGPRSLHAVLDKEAGYVQFFEQILQEGHDRRVFTGDPRLAADIIAFVCSIVALRRWNLRRRFAPEEIRDGLVAFILRALGVPERSHHASAPVARA